MMKFTFLRKEKFELLLLTETAQYILFYLTGLKI